MTTGHSLMTAEEKLRTNLDIRLKVNSQMHFYFCIFVRIRFYSKDGFECRLFFPLSFISFVVTSLIANFSGDLFDCCFLLFLVMCVTQVFEHHDGSKSLKLGDFGLATVVNGPLYTMCGTPTYVAPEIVAETG